MTDKIKTYTELCIEYCNVIEKLAVLFADPAFQKERSELTEEDEMYGSVYGSTRDMLKSDLDYM